ncbi:MAG: hypothetical protein ACREJB_07420 [Planctomycetaceae bacterium]
MSQPRSAILPERPTVLTTPVAIGLHAVPWAALLIGFCILVPRFKLTFEDFGADLPGLTILIMSASELFLLSGYALPVVLFVSAMLLDVLLLTQLARQRAWTVRVLWFWLMLLAPFGATAILVLSIFVPYVNLLQDLS